MKDQTEEQELRIADYGDYLSEVVETLRKQEKTYFENYEKSIIRTHQAEMILARFNRLQKQIKSSK